MLRNIRLAPVDLTTIKLGAALPFNLVDSRGVLLAHKGFVFETEKILNDLGNHESGFYVDFSDISDPYLRMMQRSYVNRLMAKLRGQKSLEEVCKVQVRYSRDASAQEEEPGPIDWRNMAEVTTSMLSTRDAQFFQHSLHNIADIMAYQLTAHADETLVALFYLSENEPYHYSATHALLVCAICVLTATSVLQWDASDIDLLVRCTLTMNIGMVALQDTLASQVQAPDLSQRVAIEGHSTMSVQVLELFDVTDADWLEVIRRHHDVIAEPLQCARRAERLAGLIQRADSFSAKLSARAARQALRSPDAMKSIYFQPDAKPDALGAAIIKAVGIYRPGSFVKLASGELGVVIRRGANTAKPIVAVVINREGIARSAVAVRNTAEAAYTVQGSVASAHVHVKLALDHLLELSHRSA